MELKMDTLVYKILTHPSLERFRARIPHPIYSGLVALVASIPVVLLTGLTVKSPAKASHDLPAAMLAVPPACFLAVTLLFGILALVGWLSGYRPFAREWGNLAPGDAESLLLRCMANAEALGFSTFWQKESAGFVAVLGMEREGKNAFHSGSNVPVRASFFLSEMNTPRARAGLKLEVRTVVLWDTGECQRVRALGEAVIANE